MPLTKKTVRDVDVAGKRVLVRVDFNVPLDKETGQVTDDTRIRAALPTIEYLLGQGARVILVSHFGRPKGAVNEALRMDPVAVRLAELLGKPVTKLDDCAGEEVRQAVQAMSDSEVVLLENVRFYPEEEKNDEGFARQLAELADLFVNDAFGAAHRAHASTAGVAEFLPAVAGLLMEKELAMLGGLLTEPARPFVAVIGGAKVSDKIAVMANLLKKVDALLIGGGMANTLLKARGIDVGKSLLEADRLEMAREMLAEAKTRGVVVQLPVDVVAAPGMAPDMKQASVPVEQIPPEWMALDIGPETVERFGEILQKARTVVWNGPMGVFEMEQFAGGTEAVAAILAGIDGVTVIGGGDSVAAVKKAGVSGRITHISTGGGATLEFLEGRELPGVAALLDQEKKPDGDERV